MSEEIKKTETDEESVNAEESTNGAETTTKVVKKTSGKKSLILLVVFVLLVVGALVSNKYGVFEKVFNKETPSEAIVIATVGDGVITQAELNKKIESIRKSLPEGASDPTEDAAFEMQLLNDLIDLKLLVSEAESKNYTVTDEDINAQRDLLVEQFGGEDELNAQLEKFGVSQEELLENMRNELLIKQLLSDETGMDDIEISDEEIKTTYDSMVAGSEDAPALAEVSEMIKSQLINQKSADMVSEYLSKLREKANVEIKL